MISGRTTFSSGFGQLEALCIQAGLVGGEHVAAAGVVSSDNLVSLFEGNHFVLHVVGTEVVGHVQLGGGAGVGADRRADSLSAESTPSDFFTMKPWPS
jgi:hypothetical protein